jgi:uncharacterized protein YbjT (DUF2867 family)
MDVLILGARGTLGNLVDAELTSRGHRVIAHRRGQPLERADVIVNCAGASVAMGLGHGWRGYRAVDIPIGLAAVDHARATGARLVYVAAHHTPALRRCAYVDAHEQVAEAMRDVDGTVVRATGFYAVFASLLSLARHGWLVDVGAGRARTNPISERDLAAIVADAAAGGPRELAAGGPEVLTRRELFEQIAAAANRKVRIVRAPVWLARTGSAMLSLVHPRIGQFAQFAARLATNDTIAPQLGTTRLADYLAAPLGSTAQNRPASATP